MSQNKLLSLSEYRDLIYSKKEENIRAQWEKIFNSIRDIINKYPESESSPEPSYTWFGDTKSGRNKDFFEPEFIKFYINQRLKIPGTIMSNAFSLSTIDQSSYLTGVFDNVYRWGFSLKTRERILEESNGLVVYNNIREVAEFMMEGNWKYSALLEIKNLFPIKIEAPYGYYSGYGSNNV